MRIPLSRIGAVAAAIVLGLVLHSAVHAATIDVFSPINTSQLWTANNEYVLKEVVYVTDGATLTIEPGTVIRGEPEEIENDPGALVITRGSQIRALGTELNPIVFTNLDDDNLFASSSPDPGGSYASKLAAYGTTGTWGGVILLGNGYVSNGTLGAPDPAKEVQIEGLVGAGGLGLYGNCAASGLALDECDDDNSGTMSYVSIRYGGFNLSAANEINGLTLGAVGRETDLHHIEIYQNRDDGVEFFGGAAGIKNLIVVNPGDDSVDYDEGWRGKLQFVFIVQGAVADTQSDKAGEHDGGNSPDGSLPFAIPTIYNATYVGLGGLGASNGNVNDPVKAYSGRDSNTNILLRDNAGGRYFNSFFGNFGGATLLIEGGDNGTSSTASLSSGERAETAYVSGSGFCSVTTSTACQLDADCPGGEVCVLHYREEASATQLAFEDDYFWCFGRDADIPTGQCSVTTTTTCLSNADCPGGEVCNGAAGDAGGSGSKIHHDPGIFGVCSGGSNPGFPCDVNADCLGGGTCVDSGLGNIYADCSSALPIRELTRGFEILPTKPNPVDVIDPRPTAGSPLVTSSLRTPPADGFFIPAAYRGAFGDDNWAEGWSNMSHLDYFPAKPQVEVFNPVNTSQTWTADNEYILKEVVYVTDGATVTIEPGTVVRGEPEEVENDPGALVITRGAQIDAQGTVEAPIVFTNLDDDSVGSQLGLETGTYANRAAAYGTTGTWGGVILLGNGYVSNGTLGAPDPAKEVQIEGLVGAGGLGLYGNCAASGLALDECDDDDSGTMNYVSIRYGGFNLSAANEINGLTMGAVGRETDLQHIEIYQNRDDGVEFFGGAAGIKNLLIVHPGDDSVDYDEGWRGKLQFVLVVQGAVADTQSDKAGEHDGGNSPDGSLPFAIPTIYNATYVGLGGLGASNGNVNDPVRAYSGRDSNTNILLRDNAGGRYFNSLFGNFGGATLLIEGGDNGTSSTAALSAGERAETDYVPDTGFCSVTTSQACGTGLPACPGGEVCVLHYQEEDSEAQLAFENNYFWCFGLDADIPTGECSVTTTTACLSNADCPGGETCVGAAGSAGGSGSKIHHDPGIFGVCSGGSNPGFPCDVDADCLGGGTCADSGLDNVYADCSSELPIRELTRDFEIIPTKPNPIAALDPRRSLSGRNPALNTNRKPPRDGFFTPAAYKGGFGDSNWTTGWSNASRLGLFPACRGESGAGPVPDEVLKMTVDKGADNVSIIIGWDAPQLQGLGGVQLYDTGRNTGPANWSSPVLVEDDDTDLVTVDPSVPSNVYYYLVRAVNPCGNGPWGRASDGTER